MRSRDSSSVRLPPLETVPVFILCGGLGTRLRSVDARPKAIVPVAGLPFLAYSLRLLALQGFARVHLLLGNGAQEIREVFSGPSLEYSEESEPMGTGGALGLVRDRAERVNLILNGDSYAESIYEDLLAAHAEGGEEADHDVVLLAVRMDDASPYGGLSIDPEGRVLAFREKGMTGPGWINAGVYAAGGAVMKDLPQGRHSLERDVLPGLAAAGRLRAMKQRFFFRDIGTPERLAAAQNEFRRIRARIGPEETIPWLAGPLSAPPGHGGVERDPSEGSEGESS